MLLLSQILNLEQAMTAQPWQLYSLEKKPVPIDRRQGGPKGQSGLVQKSAVHTGIQSHTVHLHINFSTRLTPRPD